jgi:hypothetical protein
MDPLTMTGLGMGVMPSSYGQYTPLGMAAFNTVPGSPYGYTPGSGGGIQTGIPGVYGTAPITGYQQASGLNPYAQAGIQGNPNIIGGSMPGVAPAMNIGGPTGISGLLGSMPILGNVLSAFGLAQTPAQQLNQQYQTAYGQAALNNQQLYENILAGYQQTMGNQNQAQGGIAAGYGALGGQVANTLGFGGTPWGVAQPAATAIANTYQQQLAQNQANLTSAGLGNTTVVGAMGSGAAQQAQQAYAGLGSQLAQTYAGYQANLGQAGLGYLNQATMQNTALANQQMQWMNSTASPYPNAQQYQQQAQQAGYAMGAGGQSGLGGLLNQLTLGIL